MIDIMMTQSRLYVVVIVVWIFAGLTGLIFAEPQWSMVIVAWLFYALGNGTVSHRYFAHGSFEVGRWMHWTLALWSTLCAYAPLHYWKVQHLHHHRNSDNEHDLHAPRNGFFRSFLLWPFSAQRLNTVFKERSSLVILARAMRDPAVSFFSRNFFTLNFTWIVVLMLIMPSLIFEVLGVAYLIEQVRLGLINTITHTPSIPGNYTNYPNVGSDKSQNNWLLGLISLGFAWHNNHHANPQRLILTQHWWEIDIEGYAGWAISRLSLRGKTA